MKAAKIPRASSITVASDPLKQRAQAWPAPRHVVTFLRCLHLLHLDLLEDWPGISELTFSTKSALQNLQQRVKCVEWSLYRLFEIYDPGSTWNKLRPFFPPLTPLHSLNLRAALFRSLTDLKKSGVLGRDVVLRKTMLDECKGEKFEEVLEAFALMVLKNQVVALDPHFQNSISGQLGQDLDQAQLLPLILAHRKSLQKGLKQRQDFAERAHKYQDWLQEQEHSLRERRSEVENLPSDASENDLAWIEDQVRNFWTGDDRWADILLHGVPAKQPCLQHPFESSWDGLVSENDPDDKAAPKSLVDQLDLRIAEQEARLKRWQAFHASLESARNARAQVSQKAAPPETAVASPRFDQHQGLHLDRAKIAGKSEIDLNSSHARLLRSMEEELSALAKKRPKPSQDNVNDHHKDGVPEATFSPQSLSQQGLADSSSGEFDAATTQAVTPPVTFRSVQASTANPEMSRVQQDSLQQVEQRQVFETGPRRRDVKAKGVSEKHPPVDGMKPNYSTPDGPSSSSTLFERTLLSMSISRGGEYPSSPKKPTTMSATPMIPPSLPQTDYLSTVPERTRQPMPLLQDPAPNSSRTSESWMKQPRLSQTFPVNQLETPRKLDPQVTDDSPQVTDDSPQSGMSTPRDRLFTDKAEYASVFKSRPKVALSPALSPGRSRMELESSLEEGMGLLTLDKGGESF